MVDGRPAWLAAMSLLLPLASAGQTLNGSAEVNITRNNTASTNQSTSNGSLGQLYTLGGTLPILDPRLARVNGEVSLHRSSLTARGTRQATQTGLVHDLGYRLGTALFSSGSIPVTLEASRLRSTSNGDLAPSNAIRGAALVTGAVPLAFETETSLLTLGARLNRPGLPLADVNYRSGRSVVAGGPYRSQQNDRDLSASVSRDTTRVHQSLRYQQSQFDSYFPQTFANGLTLFDYDLSTRVTSRLHLTAHAGRRTTNVRSVLETPIEASTAPYELVTTNGQMASRYASAGLSWDPNPRVGVRLSGTVDAQRAADGATDSRLGTLAAHYTVVRGLTLEGTGTTGTREQTLDGRTVQVVTQSGTAGASYRTGPRWLEAVVSTLRGAGLNTSVDGRRGRSVMWTREGALSSTIRWVGLGVGYEHARSEDELLSLGNYDSERVRASTQLTTGRVALTLSGDRLWLVRGDSATTVTNLQRTWQATTGYRLWQQNQLTATAGGFSNTYWRPYGPGRDDTLFLAVGTQITPRPNLQISGFLRQETARASSTNLDQLGLSGFGRLDYRLRTWTLGLELRNTRSRMQYGALTPDTYQGRQLRVSLVRRFRLSR